MCLFLIYIDQWAFVCQEKNKISWMPCDIFRGEDSFSSAFCTWPGFWKRELQICFRAVWDGTRKILFLGHFLFPQSLLTEFNCACIHFLLMKLGPSSHSLQLGSSPSSDEMLWLTADSSVQPRVAKTVLPVRIVPGPWPSPLHISWRINTWPCSDILEPSPFRVP